MSTMNAASVNRNDYYYPDELLNEKNIITVDSVDSFSDMLAHFESNNIDVIGLDCEWKPMFEKDDDSEEAVEIDAAVAAAATANANSLTKNKRPNILQIATRQKTFLVEFKDLPDKLDETLVNKFGEVILFSDKLLKLGYAFCQDSSKLLHVFPKFQHKFCEFSDDVVNIDKIVLEVRRKFYRALCVIS